MTSYAATGPFESLFAQGDFMRKAVSRGRWPWWVRTLVGLCLFVTVLTQLLGILLPR